MIKLNAPSKNFTKRKIFKHKNPNFEEVNPEAPRTIRELQTLTKGEAVEMFFGEIGRYINENR